ncbi:hypothetical protein ACWCWE_21455, partial [Streptomyces sp. NPDC001759]
MTYHLPAGKALGGPYVVDVTPEKAGWGHSSLRVLELPPGGTHTFDTGGHHEAPRRQGSQGGRHGRRLPHRLVDGPRTDG